MPKVTRQSAAPKKKASSSVLDRLTDISEVEPHFKLLLYGSSGSGKTTLAGTFPKDLLHIVCSSIGMEEALSIQNQTGITVVELQHSSELTDLVEWQRSEQKFKTVVLDHATGLEELILKEILGLEEIPVQKSWGMAKREDYATRGLQLRLRLKELLNLDCNVVVNVQEKIIEPEDESTLGLAPTVMGALSDKNIKWLNSACSFCYQMYTTPRMEVQQIKVGEEYIEQETPTNEVEYRLRMKAHPIYYARTRTPRRDMPDSILNPTYDKIRAVIDGTYSETPTKKKGVKKKGARTKASPKKKRA